ncbi:MAG: 3-dehydroquinate dehydratase [Bacteroidota bacterium]
MNQARQIVIINGPNLNLLGARQPEIYGNQTWDDYFETLQELFPSIRFSYYQSNVEGVLIDLLQKASLESDGIILNAGGYTHTSVAIADAIAAIATGVIEVHISQPLARESFRHQSILAAHAVGSISGFGMDGYQLAVSAWLLKWQLCK